MAFAEILMPLSPLSFLNSLPTFGLIESATPLLPPLELEHGTIGGADTFRRFENMTRSERRSEFFPRDALLGGIPLVGMDWGTFAALVIGAGIATLIIRRVQFVWEARTRPFGLHSDINLLIHNWAVTNEDEALVMAANIGRLFLRSTKGMASSYDHEHFQIPYTIDPKAWSEIQVKRNELTGRFVSQIVRAFRDFGFGLSLLSNQDYGDVYRDFFKDFMDKIYLAIGPLTRWQDPPTGEDLHNFDHFRVILRREIQALEVKIREVPAAQAV